MWSSNASNDLQSERRGVGLEREAWAQRGVQIESSLFVRRLSVVFEVAAGSFVVRSGGSS